MSARRPAAGLLAAVLATLVLAACSSVPTGGPVRTGERTPVSREDQSVRVLARAPAPGATPLEVVRGFLAASASFENDHAVARMYLTEAAAARWRPSEIVTVYDATGQTTLRQPAEDRVVLRASRSLGFIRADGTFLADDTRGGVTNSFSLARQDGQWRIATPPRGLLLSSTDVQRSFRQVGVYFPSLDGSVLVPDVVHVPAARQIARTRLAERLLEGPSAWLAPAVRTAFPAGTSVLGVGRPSATGVVDVVLSTQALSASAPQRRLMLAQLAYTLGQLPEVVALRVEAGGLPFSGGGAGPLVRVSDLAALGPGSGLVSPVPYVLRDGRLNVVQGEDRQRAVEGRIGELQGLSAAAVSLDQSLQAAVARDSLGPFLVVGRAGTAVAEVQHRGSDIGQLTFDREGALWFVDHPPGAPDEVYVLPRDGEPERVAVNGLGDRRVDAMRVARDGARAALVLRSPDGSSELLVARVERDGPVPRLAGLRALESVFTEVLDVAWADDTTVVVAASDELGVVQAYLVGVGGGFVTSIGIVPGMSEVAAAPGQPPLAGTEDGDVVWARGESGWRQHARGDHPLYPG